MPKPLKRLPPAVALTSRKLSVATGNAISFETIRAAVKNGRLTTYPAGSRQLILVSEFENAMREGRFANG